MELKEKSSQLNVRELCLNDQGGAIMDVSYGKSGTIRAQMGGHPPIILENVKKWKTLSATASLHTKAMP